ncbi:MAG: phosphatidylglycerophosphatase A [Candidatus Puniceispirillaceae bacterium]|jgi:phosphatidylglycerophosphatase A
MTGRAWMMLATLGPVGRFRPAPGSWGSAAAVLVAAGLVQLGGWTLEIAALIVCVLGVRAADIYDRETGSKDASDIVIDEVAGQWITLLVVPFDWRWWIAAFVAFRLFDILKPGPVRLAERLPGGYGVMADDIVAGALAAACLLALQWALA